MHGKAITVLEMDYPIVEFMVLCETPYNNGKGVPIQLQELCPFLWSHFSEFEAFQRNVVFSHGGFFTRSVPSASPVILS